MLGIGNDLNASTLSSLAWQPDAAPVRDGLATAADRTSVAGGVARMLEAANQAAAVPGRDGGERTLLASEDSVTAGGVRDAYDLQLFREADGRDRKSTRLNSSHVKISYAVFCLKKKI